MVLLCAYSTFQRAEVMASHTRGVFNRFPREIPGTVWHKWRNGQKTKMLSRRSFCLKEDHIRVLPLKVSLALGKVGWCFVQCIVVVVWFSALLMLRQDTETWDRFKRWETWTWNAVFVFFRRDMFSKDLRAFACRNKTPKMACAFKSMTRQPPEVSLYAQRATDFVRKIRRMLRPARHCFWFYPWKKRSSDGSKLIWNPEKSRWSKEIYTRALRWRTCVPFSRLESNNRCTRAPARWAIQLHLLA